MLKKIGYYFCYYMICAAFARSVNIAAHRLYNNIYHKGLEYGHDACIELARELHSDPKYWKLEYKRQCSHNGIYQLTRGKYYLNMGNYLAAKRCLVQRPVLMDPEYDNRFHIVVLGDVYCKLFHSHKVYDLAQQLLKRDPEWFGGAFLLGKYYSAIGYYKLAEICYLKALGQHRESDEKQFSKGKIYLELVVLAHKCNKTYQVVDYYQKYSYRFPDINNSVASYNIKAAAAAVMANATLGRFVIAEKILQDHVALHGNIGNQWIDKEHAMMQKAKAYYEDAKLYNAKIYHEG